MFKIQTLNAISDVIYQQLPADKYMIAKEETAPDGILVRSAAMHDMELPDSLLAIGRAGAGVNNIPIDKCSRQGIVVFNTPGANANAVAELVMAGLLMTGRKIVDGINWAGTLAGQGAEVGKLVEKGKNQFVGPELRGKTLGVIGLGAIGALVANTASRGFGMKVLGYDPFISVDNAWSLSSTIRHAVSVDEVLAEADFVTFHIPLTDKTKGMINGNILARMKKGARLLNFARGELADTAAVLEALESGKLTSYVTDFPSDDLLNKPGVICIPHLGASTPESEDNCAEMAAAQVAAYLECGSIKNSVNLPEVILGEPEHIRVQVIHENIPNMLATISGCMSHEGINIETLINRSRKDMAVTVMETADTPSDETIAAIRAIEGVVRVRVFGA